VRWGSRAPAFTLGTSYRSAKQRHSSLQAAGHRVDGGEDAACALEFLVCEHAGNQVAISAAAPFRLWCGCWDLSQRLVQESAARATPLICREPGRDQLLVPFQLQWLLGPESGR
jgi:hypothetical protein